MQTSLDRVCLGETVVVTGVAVSPELEKRLLDFGFIPGTKIKCCYRHPGGNVTAIACRGTVIAMRTQDLCNIQVRC